MHTSNSEIQFCRLLKVSLLSNKVSSAFKLLTANKLLSPQICDIITAFSFGYWIGSRIDGYENRVFGIVPSLLIKFLTLVPNLQFKSPMTNGMRLFSSIVLAFRCILLKEPILKYGESWGGT